MLSFTSYNSSAENLLFYQNHVTSQWLLCDVIELEHFDDYGMIIAHDQICAQNKLKNQKIIPYPLVGCAKVLNSKFSREIWLNYIVADILKENPLSNQEKIELCDQYLLDYLGNLRLPHFLSEEGQFFSNIRISELLDDRILGTVLLPKFIMSKLKVKENDSVVIRLDIVYQMDEDIRRELTKKCIWI